MTNDAAVLLERSIDSGPESQNGIHTDLLCAGSAERVPGPNVRIRYDQVILRKRIPDFAPAKEFDVVILDPIEGTLTFYRDYNGFDANKPSAVVHVRLALKEEPTEEQVR